MRPEEVAALEAARARLAELVDPTLEGQALADAQQIAAVQQFCRVRDELLAWRTIAEELGVDGLKVPELPKP